MDVCGRAHTATELAASAPSRFPDFSCSTEESHFQAVHGHGTHK